MPTLTSCGLEPKEPIVKRAPRLRQANRSRKRTPRGNISHTGLGRKHDLSHPLPRRLSGNRSISTDKDISFANKFVNTVGKQFHPVMDPYVDINLEIMDSVFTKRLNDRFIRPQFVAVEVIDLQG